MTYALWYSIASVLCMRPFDDLLSVIWFLWGFSPWSERLNKARDRCILFIAYHMMGVRECQGFLLYMEGYVTEQIELNPAIFHLCITHSQCLDQGFTNFLFK